MKVSHLLDLGEYEATPAKRSRRVRIYRAIALAIGVIVVTGAIARLFFGVDLTDESYYAAVTYRFVLGDTPYKSDFELTQNSALLTEPVVSAWVGVMGSTDGIVLVLRFAYLAMRLAVVALAVRVLWRRVPMPLAVSIALLPCAFVLFVVPAPSYNTISASAVTVSLLGLWLWRERGRRRDAAIALGGAVVASFAHPALLPFTVVGWIGVVALAPSQGLRKSAWRIAGCVVLIVLIAAGALFGPLGLEGTRRFFHEVVAYELGGAAAGGLLAMPARLFALTHFGPVLVLLWMASWFAMRLSPSVRLGILGSYIAITWLADNQAGFVWLALLALPLTWQLHRRGSSAGLTVAAFSVGAGLLVGLSSSNGVSNVASGAEVAVMAGFLAMHLLSVREADASRAGSLMAMAPMALALLTCMRFSVSQWRDVYRDDPIRRLTATVDSGPYRWLRTTPEKRSYINRVQRALRTYADGRQSLLVFNRFPGAHLMVPVRPAAPTVWVSANGTKRSDIAEALRNAPKPALALAVYRLPERTNTGDRWSYDANDPILVTLREIGASNVGEGGDFSIFLVPANPSTSPPLSPSRQP